MNDHAKLADETTGDAVRLLQEPNLTKADWRFLQSQLQTNLVEPARPQICQQDLH